MSSHSSSMFLRVWKKLWKRAEVFLIDPVSGALLRFLAPLRARRLQQFLSSPHPPKTILVIFFGSGLGDCIIFSGILEAVRKRFPAAQIRVVVLSGLEKYLEGNPWIDELIACPSYFKRGWRGAFEFFGIALRIRKGEPIDLILETCPNKNRMPALWQLLVPKRISLGIGNALKQLFYDYSVPIRGDQHFLHCLFDVLSPLEIQRSKPSFWIPPEANLDGLVPQEFLSANTVVAAPGLRHALEVSNDHLRVFPEFPRVINELTARGHPVILTGAEYDRPYLKGIIPRPCLINLVGKTTIPQLFSLIRRAARLVICNNSASLHIAVALDIPTVSYAHRAHNIVRWSPYGNHGRHIVLQDRPDKRVSSKYFLEAVLSQLEREPAYRRESWTPALF